MRQICSAKWLFVGDVTRGQIDSIDETFTAEDIQAYDEILHNALQESDVADFLTAYKQAVIDRENASRVPTEEEVLFPNMKVASIAKNIIAQYGVEPDQVHGAAMAAFIYRTHLVGELNDLKTQIEDLKEKLKVLKKYRKVKHIGEELKALSVKDEKKYRREHSGEIAEYYETRDRRADLCLIYSNIVC